MTTPRIDDRRDAAIDAALTKAALACNEDVAALRPLFDALAIAPTTPELLEDLRTRFAATLGVDVASALLDGVDDVAEVARRGERMIRISAAAAR